PSDKARYGSFYVLAEEAEQAVRAIIEESQSAEAGTEQRKVGDLFTSFMDEQRIEQLGAEPLRPALESVDAVASVADLLATLGLPDESYFREERFAEVRDKYRAFIERMFTLAGIEGAADAAARVFELETAIASHHWDNVRTRDAEATYNLTSWSETAGEHLGAW